MSWSPSGAAWPGDPPATACRRLGGPLPLRQPVVRAASVQAHTHVLIACPALSAFLPIHLHACTVANQRSALSASAALCCDKNKLRQCDGRARKRRCASNNDLWRGWAVGFVSCSWPPSKAARSGRQRRRLFVKHAKHDDQHVQEDGGDDGPRKQRLAEGEATGQADVRVGGGTGAARRKPAPVSPGCSCSLPARPPWHATPGRRPEGPSPTGRARCRCGAWWGGAGVRSTARARQCRTPPAAGELEGGQGKREPQAPAAWHAPPPL